MSKMLSRGRKIATSVIMKKAQAWKVQRGQGKKQGEWRVKQRGGPTMSYIID
jgi:hypothetical protein